ncbi:MAG TPA: ATP synthase F1 subunit gamma [Candidatus Acidoferrales bacterium]|jgi:F-type H+-transporting ATPase subunit gamma|nr:ATP synthase F1 subunit gamma [Candidatus Acidoferrales bacterium]
MPTQLDIKRRIRSVKNTQQITRAMKFVAAARLRRAQERAFAARPYARAISRMVASAAARVPESEHPLLRRSEEKRILLLSVSGERGLCGAFNANVIRRTLEFLRDHAADNPEIVVLGRKIRDAMRKQPWKIVAEYVDITARPDLAKAAEIGKEVIALYERAEIDSVYIVFNEFKSVLTQNLRLEKLLPIEPQALSAAPDSQVQTGESTVDYLFEQPPAELLGGLLPRYVQVHIYRALAESAAAEHAARMTAMDSATNNAGELIDQLTLYMNKVRQAAITKEIIEVVSGAASAA